MLIQNISLRFSRYLTKELKIEDEQPVIDYGIQIFLGGLLKISSIMVISYLLGVFTPTILIMTSASIFRSLSGGPHCTSYWRCFMSVHVVFLTLGLISDKLVQGALSFNIAITIFTLTTFVLIIVIYFWAPGAHKERQISERKKLLSKWISALFVLVIYIITVFSSEAKPYYTIPVFLGLIWQGITITPKGYWLMSILDKVLTFRVGEVKSC